MGGSLLCFPLLFLVTLITYLGGISIEKACAETKDRAKAILALVLFFVLSILFFFKYFGFVQDTLFRLTGMKGRGLLLPLPAGISFYSFQSLSYCLDVYRGTADAISQNIDFIDSYDPEYLLILSGDHIYKMDYSKMLDYHKEQNAVASIAVMPVTMEEATRFGIMITDENNRIIDFEEKPAHPRSTLASMGIYIFTWKELRALLVEDMKNPDSEHDFGKNIIPTLLAMGKKMVAYKFEGYWKGTDGNKKTIGIGYNSEKFVAYGEKEGKLSDGLEVDSYKADLKHDRLYLYSPGFKGEVLVCRLEGPDTLVIVNGKDTYRYVRTNADGPPLSTYTEKRTASSGGGVGTTVNTLTFDGSSKKKKKNK